jgi:hypothetical protein
MINSGQVGTLYKIAVRASQCEVHSLGCAAVLTRNDVFDVKAQFREFLRKMAVFATLAGPPADQPD